MYRPANLKILLLLSSVLLSHGKYYHVKWFLISCKPSISHFKVKFLSGLPATFLMSLTPFDYSVSVVTQTRRNIRCNLFAALDYVFSFLFDMDFSPVKKENKKTKTKRRTSRFIKIHEGRVWTDEGREFIQIPVKGWLQFKRKTPPSTVNRCVSKNGRLHNYFLLVQFSAVASLWSSSAMAPHRR